MIYLYSGTPGSYKSYHAVCESILWLRLGGNLITNFPLNYKNVIKRPIKGVYEFINNIDLSVDYLIKFAAEHHVKNYKPQTMVVIDEASILFNPRDFGRRGRMDWINFLANHRHFNYDIVLIVQSDIMLDKQIRALIESEYKHRAVKNYKLFGRILNLIFRGLFLYVDIWYPCKLYNGNQWMIFNKKIASCYDTLGLIEGSKFSEKRKAAESSVNNSKGVLKIANVHDPITKKQVHNDLTKLVNCICDYVQRNCGTV